LIVWAKHGSKTYRYEVDYTPDFCLRSDQATLEAAESLLRDDPRVLSLRRAQRRLWLRGPTEEVLEVRPRNLHHMFWLATDLRRKTRTRGYLFFDVDHQPESRWMHARGLFPMCRLKLGPEGPVLERAPDEDRWSLHYPTPELRTVRLEARGLQQGHVPEFQDPLDSITLGDRVFTCPPGAGPAGERAALLEFAAALRSLDPDVLITHHGDRWDIPYLLRKIRLHHLEGRVRLGREADPDPARPDQAAKSIHTYGQWLFKTHAYYLRGRWHVDLSKKTLDTDDDRKDLHGVVYLARIANRRPQDINRNGAGYALQQMQIDAATDLGVALPWKRNLAEDWKDAATLCAVDRGGQIMVPRPGIYEDVVACDFSGYYPSIVIRHNLSSDTINCACCPDGPVVPELGYHVCTRVAGHQSEILRRLQPHRPYVKAVLRRAQHDGALDPDVVAKARAVKAEQKALGVVCFGYFRYRNARFGCAEVHQAIQCYGRAGMTRAREIARDMGFEMIHAMTDCAFLQRRGVTKAEAFRVARRISSDLGLAMDVEGLYSWIVFLPSKTHSTSSTVGVPNRYYGRFEDGQLKVRGIDVQKHITPGWIYDTQQGMLDVFAQARDAAAFKARIPEALEVSKRASERLRRREVEASELGVMVQATKGVGEYVANTNTKAALRRLEAAGTRRQPGEYVKFVVARSVGPWDSRSTPVELMGKPGPLGTTPRPSYDINHYLRLLARSVETLLAPFGYEEDALFEWLKGRSANPKSPATRRVGSADTPAYVATGRSLRADLLPR
jgi:DNA polymerase elongation subunit (family B)